MRREWHLSFLCFLTAVPLAGLGWPPLEEPGKVTSLKLGEPAPEFTLWDATGRSCALRDFRDAKNILLLLNRGLGPQTLREAASKLAAIDTVLLVIMSPASVAHSGHPNLRVLNDRDGVVTRTYVADSVVPAAFLVDKSGILRRAGRAKSVGELVAFVREWETGKTAYLSACARCHEDESYPLLKNLHGIGNRLTRAQILDRMFAVTLTPDEIFIRSHLFNRRQLDALLTYVSGL